MNDSRLVILLEGVDEYQAALERTYKNSIECKTDKNGILIYDELDTRAHQKQRIQREVALAYTKEGALEAHFACGTYRPMEYVYHADNCDQNHIRS